MAFEGLRESLQLATGMVELSRARAVEAASALLSFSATVSRGALGSQVQDFAEELMAAASANRRTFLALVRAEVDAAMARAAVRQTQDLERARTAIAALATDVDELRRLVHSHAPGGSLPGAGRAALGAMSGVASMLGVSGERLPEAEPGADAADGLIEAPPEPATGAARGRPAARTRTAPSAGSEPAAKRAPRASASSSAVTTSAGGRPAAKTAAGKTSTAKTAAGTRSARQQSAAETGTARESAARQSPPKASPAKKSMAKTSAAKTSAAQASPARKSAAKTSAAKTSAAKTSTAKTSTAKTSTAKTSAAKKSTETTGEPS